MPNNINDRIVQLYSNGGKPKAIAEALKMENVKTIKGKTPDLKYVQNKIFELRRKGLLNNTAKVGSSEAAFMDLAKHILWTENFSAEKKVACLQTLFS